MGIGLLSRNHVTVGGRILQGKGAVAEFGENVKYALHNVKRRLHRWGSRFDSRLGIRQTILPILAFDVGPHLLKKLQVVEDQLWPGGPLVHLTIT